MCRQNCRLSVAPAIIVATVLATTVASAHNGVAAGNPRPTVRESRKFTINTRRPAGKPKPKSSTRPVAEPSVFGESDLAENVTDLLDPQEMATLTGQPPQDKREPAESGARTRSPDGEGRDGRRLNAGRLRILNGTRQTLGSVARGSQVRHVFKLRNEGPGILHVALLEVTCPCMQVRLAGQDLAPPSEPALTPLPVEPVDFEQAQRDMDKLKEQILSVSAGESPHEADPVAARTPPETPDAEKLVWQEIPAGKTVDLEVSWDTTDASGHYDRTAWLVTTDERHATVAFDISVEVIPAISLSKPLIDFGAVPSGDVRIQTVRLSSNVLKSFSVKSVRSPIGELHVRSHRVSPEECRAAGIAAAWDIDVELMEDAPVGTVDAELSVVTDVEGQTPLQILVVGRVTSSLKLGPASLVDLGTFVPTEPPTSGMYVRIPGTEVFKSKVVECSPSAFRATVDVVKNVRGEQFLLVEVTAPGGLPEGDIEGFVLIETSLKDARRVRISIRGRVLSELPLNTVPELAQ